MNRKLLGAFVGLSSAFLTIQCAKGAITLTSAGVADGFTLTTFASGFPSMPVGTGNQGPVGIAFENSGAVMVADGPGNVRVFPNDVNGQLATSVTAINYGVSNSIGLTQLGTNIYMSEFNSGKVVQLNRDGSLNRTVASGLSNADGLVGDAFTGHLLVSTGPGIIEDVNPTTGASVSFVSQSAPDGLALSPDGQTLYIAHNAVTSGAVFGYNTTTKSLVFNSGAINLAEGPVVAAGSLAGNIFVNSNDGRLVEVNLSTSVQTVIATGGTRGSYLTVDPNDGSLMVTQSDSILRLTGGIFAVTHPIVSVKSTTPTALYGSAITNGTGTSKGMFSGGGNSLAVNGQPAGAEVTGINSGSGMATGFVSATGLSPGTQPESYALDVLINGLQASSAQIATIVSDMNSANAYGSNPNTVASAVDPTFGTFSQISPITPYNLYLTFSGTTSGSNYLAFDLSQDPTYGATASVVAVAAVPEPAIFSLLAVACIACSARRRSAQ